MRYRLRTLLIVVAVGPPLVAGFQVYLQPWCEWRLSQTVGDAPYSNVSYESWRAWRDSLKRYQEAEAARSRKHLVRPMFRFTIRDVLWLTVVVAAFCSGRDWSRSADSNRPVTV